MTAKFEKKKWINWYENLSCDAVVVDAASEQDVVDAVRYAKQEGLALRVAGTGHSNIALVPTSGAVVVTDKLAGLQAHDTEACTVTLAAGTKIRAMGDMLWEHGLALSNQGDIDTQSIVGALSTGTHGTGLRLQNLSASIQSMRVVTASGEIEVLDNEDKLRAARVSMGMLGAITSVELRVSPAYMLHEWLAFMPYEVAAEIEDEMNEKFRNFTYFWCADARSADFVGVEVDSQGEPEKGFACVRIFDTDPIEVGELEKYTLNRRYDRSYRIYADDYLPEFDEMEYMVPLDVGRECFDELIGVVGPKLRELGIPAEVRVTAGDENYLSEFYGGPRCSISLAGRMHDDNTKLFQTCDDVFRKFDGRTHWAKANGMTRDRLKALYPRFDDFVDIRRKMDPDGLFLNDYLKPWFE